MRKSRILLLGQTQTTVSITSYELIYDLGPRPGLPRSQTQALVVEGIPAWHPLPGLSLHRNGDWQKAGAGSAHWPPPADQPNLGMARLGMKWHRGKQNRGQLGPGHPAGAPGLVPPAFPGTRARLCLSASLSWSCVISNQMRVCLQCSSQTFTGTLFPVQPSLQLRELTGAQDQPGAHPMSQTHGPWQEEGPRPAH